MKYRVRIHRPDGTTGLLREGQPTGPVFEGPRDEAECLASARNAQWGRDGFRYVVEPVESHPCGQCGHDAAHHTAPTREGDATYHTACTQCTCTRWTVPEGKS